MSQENSLALQDQYAPKSICFGCGPANSQGLQIKSYPKGNEVFAEFTPKKYHEAFPGMINGGIIGALLDCHANWTAAWHLMNKNKLTSPPCTVTADFHVKLKRPTPSQTKLFLRSWVVESTSDKAIIEAELSANEKVCATLRGTFVAVKENHPAYHRWE